MITLFIGSIALNDFIKLMDFVLVKRGWQAQITEPAINARNFGIMWADLAKWRNSLQ